MSLRRRVPHTLLGRCCDLLSHLPVGRIDSHCNCGGLPRGLLGKCHLSDGVVAGTGVHGELPLLIRSFRDIESRKRNGGGLIPLCGYRSLTALGGR